MQTFSPSAGLSDQKPRSNFSHYLPRLKKEFYQADAVVFWTMPVHLRRQGWLDAIFHAAFREMMLHAAAREGLICPAYCLMPDHIHFVWMGLKKETNQRNGVKFLRAQLGPFLRPVKFQHQAHDHVLKPEERQRSIFALACAEYVLLNPLRAKLVKKPGDWPYMGALLGGYPRANPFEADFWPWFWKIYYEERDPGIETRILPRREMERVRGERNSAD